MSKRFLALVTTMALVLSSLVIPTAFASSKLTTYTPDTSLKPYSVGGDKNGLSCTLYAPAETIGIATHINPKNINTTKKDGVEYGTVGTGDYTKEYRDNFYIYMAIGGDTSARFNRDYGIVKYGNTDQWHVFVSQLPGGTEEDSAWDACCSTGGGNFIGKITNYGWKDEDKTEGWIGDIKQYDDIQMELRYDLENSDTYGHLVFEVYGWKKNVKDPLFHEKIDMGSTTSYAAERYQFMRIASIATIFPTNNPEKNIYYYMPYTSNKGEYMQKMGSGTTYTGIEFKNTWRYLSDGTMEYISAADQDCNLWIYPNANYNYNGKITTSTGKPIVSMESSTNNGKTTDVVDFRNYDWPIGSLGKPTLQIDTGSEISLKKNLTLQWEAVSYAEKYQVSLAATDDKYDSNKVSVDYSKENVYDNSVEIPTSVLQKAAGKKYLKVAVQALTLGHNYASELAISYLPIQNVTTVTTPSDQYVYQDEDEDDDTVAVTSVTIKKSSGSNPMTVGDKLNLKTTVKPVSATYNTIRWKVISGSDVVKISSKTGESITVTAKKAGTATIKATVGGATDTYDIEVEEEDEGKPDWSGTTNRTDADDDSSTKTEVKDQEEKDDFFDTSSDGDTTSDDDEVKHDWSDSIDSDEDEFDWSDSIDSDEDDDDDESIKDPVWSNDTSNQEDADDDSSTKTEVKDQKEKDDFFDTSSDDDTTSDDDAPVWTAQ